MIKQGRNDIIDILKGLAIIAVILYHLGVFKYGYLGVDIFFVISGYLVAIGLEKDFRLNRFSFWQYINKRLSRLWPGLVLISVVSLVLGYYFMMPLHFKLNSESVIASSLFCNNIVQWITSGDYWTSDNIYKPLMHTWYIGVLMQYYLIVPLFFWIASFFKKRQLFSMWIMLLIPCVISVIIYVSPLMTTSQNFYLLPSRFFELAIGGLVAITLTEQSKENRLTFKVGFYVLVITAIVLMLWNDIDVLKLRLILVVTITAVLIWMSNQLSIEGNLRKLLLPLSFCGIASYSLYLSHQVIFAYYRYVFNNQLSLSGYLGILSIAFIIGVLLYYLFEKPIGKFISKNTRNKYFTNIVCLFIIICMSVPAWKFYKANGLVRDIPELNLYVGQNNQTPEEYNNAPHNLNKEFPQNGKKNILVIGDSFGRDWINILQEAGVDSVMNLSYLMYADEYTPERIEKADYIFVATFLPFFSSYNYNPIYPQIFRKKFWRVGLKSFSDQFIGNFYNDRHKDYYYDLSVDERRFSHEINVQEKDWFKDNYIDMMEPLKTKNGKFRIFTDDKKLITGDGIHLTKAGAKFYADKLDVWQYLK